MYHSDAFIDNLRNRWLKPKTIKAYDQLLKLLFTFLVDRSIPDIRSVRPADIIEFLLSLKNRGWADATYYVVFRRLRIYFRFLEGNGLIFLSPLRQIESPKPVQHSYPVLSTQRMQQILQQIRTDKPLYMKARALIELGYSSALRPRELYSLRISDISFQRRQLFIRQSKGNKDRLVPVGNTALFWVQRYITEVRPRYVRSVSEDYVFINHKNGRQLRMWGVRSAIQETLKASDLPPIAPYSLRSSAATGLLNQGMSIAHIGTLLGHVEIRTTQRYLKVYPKDLDRIVNIKHPRKDLDEYRKEKEESNDTHASGN